MTDTMTTEGFSTRCQKVLQVAKQLYQGRPEWITFFRETLGVNGAARSVFSNQDDYVQFEQSPEFAEIQNMVANLRNKRTGAPSKNEVTRVITVRLPESLHESLKAEAADHNTSMNKLCISKLLQALADENDASTGNQMGNSGPAASHGTEAYAAHAVADSRSPQSSGFRSTYDSSGQRESGFGHNRGYGQ